MDEIIKKIIDIKSSKSYIDYNNYHKDNLFGITRTSRLELPHSDFLAWVFNPDGLNIGYFPIYQLVKVLGMAKDRPENETARLDEKLVFRFFENDFITDVIVRREFKNIDILLEVLTKEKILPIIIENKVKSHENGKKADQTDAYFNFAEDYYKDEKKYYQPVYVFLHPEFNYAMQKNKQYIRISYQDMVDYVLEPCLYMTKDPIKKQNINSYLQSLSYQVDSDKGDEIMAISAEEKRIIEEFLKENTDLLLSIVNYSDLEDDAKNALATIVKEARDTTKYKFKGKVYSKNKLVLAVVKVLVDELVAKNSNLTLKQLEKELDPAILPNYGVYKEEKAIMNKKYLGIGGSKRYFIDDPIYLPDGSKILVCTEWRIDNIAPFLDWAKKRYQIETVA